MIDGKRYSGTCKNCESLESARCYELEIRSKVLELSKQKNVKALVENFRDELSFGEKILLSEAFDEFAKKPKRKRHTEKHFDGSHRLEDQSQRHTAQKRPQKKNCQLALCKIKHSFYRKGLS